MRIRPKSLQQRTLLYAILPTFILLITLSLFNFLFVRNILIAQWGETIVSRLERSADLIETNLLEPKKLLLLLQTDDNSLVNRQLINSITNQIRGFDIVEDVIVDWPEPHESKSSLTPPQGEGA